MNRHRSRDLVLAQVWSQVPAPGRPVLVAIDGPDGAGKSRFATDLARFADRPLVVAALDDFHFPVAHRHAAGRTGETVWARSFDYQAVRRELVDPWLAGAGTPYRAGWHDVATDSYVEEPTATVPGRGVLLVEGVFAQRAELVDAWDLVVYVDACDEVRMSRMAARDGVPDDADHPDQRRYVDAQRIYHELVAPRARADVVVDNSDAEEPLIVAPSMPT